MAAVTRAEAEAFVLGCGEQDGPESDEHAADLFEALYDRRPGAEDADVWSLCCAAVSITDDAINSNCPACEMSGLSRERALKESPRYMAALDALPDSRGGVPDEPAVECWSCRRLRAAGVDPAPLAREDAAEWRWRIRTMRDRATAAGDQHQADVCAIALAAYEPDRG